VRRVSSPAVATGFDPESEQEVDFARYGRMLARRWWLVAAGVVVGVLIGYLVSLGGTKLYSATATIYLGQPYNASGSVTVIALQTNPSAVGQYANAQFLDNKVATQCHTTVKAFRKGISIQKIATSSTPTKATAQVNPLVTVTVQAAKTKVATCTANALSQLVVAQLGTYPRHKLSQYTKQVAYDNGEIKRLGAAMENPSIPATDKLVLETTLRNDQQDLQAYSGLLNQAQFVELPQVAIPAASRQVTAQSSRNTVIIAALIGLILGVIGALFWERLEPRFSARNGS
jgi:capsular polysaccharide biosynthesis protein